MIAGLQEIQIAGLLTMYFTVGSMIGISFGVIARFLKGSHLT